MDTRICTDCIHHVFSPDSPERDAEIEYYTTAFIACGIMLGVMILIAIFGVMCGNTAAVKGDAPEEFSQRTQQGC